MWPATVSWYDALTTRRPEVPTTDTWYVPGETAPDALRTRLEEDEPVSVSGEKEAETPVGSPVAESDTACGVPVTERSTTVLTPPPCMAVPALGETKRVNPKDAPERGTATEELELDELEDDADEVELVEFEEEEVPELLELEEETEVDEDDDDEELEDELELEEAELEEDELEELDEEVEEDWEELELELEDELEEDELNELVVEDELPACATDMVVAPPSK